MALQLTNILRDVREDAERGRTYLPAEDLARFGAPEPGDDRRAGRLRERRGRASGTTRGLALTALLDRRSAACVLAMSGIYRRLLDRIEADPQAILERRVRTSAVGPRSRSLGAACSGASA